MMFSRSVAGRYRPRRCHPRRAAPLSEEGILSMSVGVLSTASGSAAVEISGTKVVVAVRGPHAPSARIDGGSANNASGTAVSTSEGDADFEGVLEISAQFAPFSGVEADNADGEALTVAASIRRALVGNVVLRAFPKAAVSIHVLVIQDCGCAAAAAVTCASLALADAGVEMYDIVAATCASVQADGDVILEPSSRPSCADSKSKSTATMYAAKTLARGELADFFIKGPLSTQATGETLDKCLHRCDRILAAMKATLVGSAAG